VCVCACVCVRARARVCALALALALFCARALSVPPQSPSPARAFTCMLVHPLSPRLLLIVMAQKYKKQSKGAPALHSSPPYDANVIARFREALCRGPPAPFSAADSARVILLITRENSARGGFGEGSARRVLTSPAANKAAQVCQSIIRSLFPVC